MLVATLLFILPFDPHKFYDLYIYFYPCSSADVFLSGYTCWSMLVGLSRPPPPPPPPYLSLTFIFNLIQLRILCPLLSMQLSRCVLVFKWIYSCSRSVLVGLRLSSPPPPPSLSFSLSLIQLGLSPFPPPPPTLLFFSLFFSFSGLIHTQFYEFLSPLLSM